MPFYFRKSISAGPFRFNLSKSGVGLSVGVRGLRIGTGPRGHYIHAGAYGFYYRASLGHAGQRPRPAAFEPVDSTQPTARRSGDVEMVDIESGDVLAMSDARLQDLLDDLNCKLQQARLSGVLALGGGAIAAGAAFLTTAPIAVGIGVALVPFGYLLGSWLDTFKRTVVLFYDLDSTPADAYRQFVSAFEAMAGCERAWHVPTEGEIRDLTTWKRNAGANTLVQRSQIALSLELPNIVRSNLDPPHIRAGRQHLYFLPNFILVVDASRAGAIAYEHLDVDVSQVRFIEDGKVPSDARIVDHTWQHPNKSGGPDRRFSYNRQLPVCLYEELHLASASGLRERIQLSKMGTGDAFASAAKVLARFGLAASTPVGEGRIGTRAPASVGAESAEGKHPLDATPAPAQKAFDFHKWGLAAFALLAVASVATAANWTWTWTQFAANLKVPSIFNLTTAREPSRETKWKSVVTPSPDHTPKSGVGKQREPKDAPQTLAASLDVVMTISIHGGSKPIIIGHTNLPAGTKVMVTISRKETSYLAREKVTVANGKFRAAPFSQDGAALRSGRYVVDISSLPAASQPALVRAVVGPQGENLRGPAIKLMLGERVVALSRNIVVGDASPSKRTERTPTR